MLVLRKLPFWAAMHLVSQLLTTQVHLFAPLFFLFNLCMSM